MILVSVCVPVELYCDGIVDCPQGSDEIQSGCSCEDWGLLSCPKEVSGQITCFNRKWVAADALEQCQAFLQGIYTTYTLPQLKEMHKGKSNETTYTLKTPHIVFLSFFFGRFIMTMLAEVNGTSQ